jgi:hypothetical protein
VSESLRESIHALGTCTDFGRKGHIKSLNSWVNFTPFSITLNLESKVANFVSTHPLNQGLFRLLYSNWIPSPSCLQACINATFSPGLSHQIYFTAFPLAFRSFICSISNFTWWSFCFRKKLHAWSVQSSSTNDQNFDHPKLLFLIKQWYVYRQTFSRNLASSFSIFIYVLLPILTICTIDTWIHCSWQIQSIKCSCPSCCLYLHLDDPMPYGSHEYQFWVSSTNKSTLGNAPVHVEVKSCKTFSSFLKSLMIAWLNVLLVTVGGLDCLKEAVWVHWKTQYLL